MSLASASRAASQKYTDDQSGTQLRTLVQQVSADPVTLHAAEEALTRILEQRDSNLRRLTHAEQSALGRMGVTPEGLEQSTSLPAAHDGAWQRQGAELRSYTAAEVALLLGVSTARVRQRAAERSLIARRQSRGWHFPTLQFPDGRELAGWATVARQIPSDVPLLLVERALRDPQPHLEIEGIPVSVLEWLTQGGDAERAATAVSDDLTRMV